MITLQHLTTLSKMPYLTSLKLQYCFGHVSPTTFSSLSDLKDSWKALEYLNITYEFGHPNWEKEDIAQLVDHLRSKMKLNHKQKSDSIILTIPSRTEWNCDDLELTIIEGGDEEI
jgi:hypothetical protein